MHGEINMTKEKEIEIHGIVTTNKSVSNFMDDFTEWIKSRKEHHTCSCKMFTGVKDQLEIGENKNYKNMDIRIRKVSVLQGKVKIEAEKQKLQPNDLVLVIINGNSLPFEYSVEKIEGDPVSYLMKRTERVV